MLFTTDVFKLKVTRLQKVTYTLFLIIVNLYIKINELTFFNDICHISIFFYGKRKKVDNAFIKIEVPIYSFLHLFKDKAHYTIITLQIPIDKDIRNRLLEYLLKSSVPVEISFF